MSLFVRQVLIRRRIDDERPWTIPAAIVVMSMFGLWMVRKPLWWSFAAILGGAFASAVALIFGLILLLMILSSVPIVIAVFYGLWLGKNWVWWLVTVSAIGLTGIALMCHLQVFPELLPTDAGALSYLVDPPLVVAPGSLAVVALLCSPPTRRWLLFCYRIRSEMLG